MRMHVTRASTLRTLSPRSMNFMATCSPVVMSLASCTNPKAPLFKSATCSPQQRLRGVVDYLVPGVHVGAWSTCLHVLGVAKQGLCVDGAQPLC